MPVTETESRLHPHPGCTPALLRTRRHSTVSVRPGEIKEGEMRLGGTAEKA